MFGLDYGDSWPLAIVAVGLAKLFAGCGVADRSMGLFMIAIGAAFQITILRLWDLDLETAWPLLVIAGGIFILLTAFDRSRRRRHKETSHDDKN